jgi:hypothetical protein
MSSLFRSLEESGQEQAFALQPETIPLVEQVSGRLRALQARWVRVQASAAGQYWTRLTAADFMTSSFAFAALGALCAFPFLAAVAAATGGDSREAIVRMGLNKEAARDVNALISSGTHAVATLTVFTGAFLVFGALGIASTLQAWYQHARRSGIRPPSRTLPAPPSPTRSASAFSCGRCGTSRR